MNIKETFLKLTAYEIPYGFEKNIEFFLPKNINKDEFGNYYLKIGETKTMFCCHLDTYSRVHQKVKHKIKDNIISTDGTTILGGDDKAGVCVLLSLIENNIPGLYYFFRGEEGILAPSGTWGSKNALKKYSDKFKNYDKCIAFDRKKKGSVITHQMWQECCSTEFAQSLIDEFKKHGMNYQEDDGGFWCDSGTFMEDISECTNISVGYDNEHTKNEIQDIEYLDKLCKTVIKMNWENLIVKRDPTVYNSNMNYSTSYKNSKYNFDDDYFRQKYGNLYDDEDDTYAADDYFYGLNKRKRKTNKRDLLFSTKNEREYYTMTQMFQHVLDIMDMIDYECLNSEYFNKDYDMFFMNVKTNDSFLLKITDFKIYITEDPESQKYQLIGDLDTFENYVTLGDSYYTQTENVKDKYNINLTSVSQLKIGLEVYHDQDGEGKILAFDSKSLTIHYKLLNKNSVYYSFEDIKNHLKLKENNILTVDELYNKDVNDISDLKESQKIYHTKIGEGYISKMTDIGKDIKITIFFYKDKTFKDFYFKNAKHLLKIKNEDNVSSKYDLSLNNVDIWNLKVNQDIYHNHYGEGKIINLNDTSKEPKIIIKFYKNNFELNFDYNTVKHILKVSSKDIKHNNEKNISDEYTVKINSINDLTYRTQVYHPKFGEGVINEVEGTDDNAKVSIYFYDSDDIKLFQFKAVKDILKLIEPF